MKYVTRLSGTRSTVVAASAVLAGLLALPVSFAAAQNAPPVASPFFHVDANDVDGDGVAEGASESGLNGGTVAVWSDKGTGNNDAAQGNPALQPLLDTVNTLQGKPVVRFDGLDDLMQTAPFASALSQPNTMFLVWQSFAAPSGTGDAVIDGLSPGGRHAIIYEARGDLGPGNPGGIILFAGAGGDSPTQYYPTNFTGPIVETAVWNDAAATNDNYIDGTLVRSADTGTDPLNGVTLGARFGPFNGDNFTLNGYIAEVLIYDELLDAGQRASVESYLNNKWIVPEPGSAAVLALVGLPLLARRRRSA